MSETRSRNDGRYSFVPAIDDILAPPPTPPIEQEQRPAQPHDAGLGFIVVTANVLVTAVIIVALLVDGQQASRAIVIGSLYFALTTTLYVVIHTGALSAIVAVWQRERTERQRIDAYAEAAQLAIHWRIRIEDNRMLELQAQALPADISRRLTQLENSMIEQTLSAGGMQTPYGKSTYVTPYDNRSTAAFAEETQPNVDTTASEALTWARGLYLDTTGEPDPGQVHTTGEQVGWLRVRMLGSRRGAGTKEAGLWLLKHKVIQRVPGGYKLNIERYPRRESLRALL